jgi:predicted dehydrogenase
MTGPASTPIGVGVLGLGFMGRTHVRAYASAHAAGFANRLIAVSDPEESRLLGREGVAGNIATGSAEEALFDASSVHAVRDPAQLFAHPEVDLVSICTPTDTHVPLAIAALEAGKHVLVEKPVAIESAQVRRLADAAKRSGRIAMPAMCMRFWPGWEWLKERIADGSLGALRGVTFVRMGGGPTWSPEFYKDLSRSGGAHFDLHVHDTDFIVHCFGRPRAVTSVGTIERISTVYHYGPAGDHAAPSIAAVGAWVRGGGFPFRIRYTAEFEHATADYDLGRESQLMLSRDGAWSAVEVPSASGYEAEVRHVLRAAAAHLAGTPATTRATMDDAVTVTQVLEAERRSTESGTTQPC